MVKREKCFFTEIFHSAQKRLPGLCFILAGICLFAMPDARGESVYMAEPMLRRISRVDTENGEYEIVSGIVWQRRFVDLALDDEGLLVALETEEPAIHTLRMTEEGPYERVDRHLIPGGYPVPNEFIIDDNGVLHQMMAGPVAFTVARNGHYIIAYSFIGQQGRRPGYIVDFDPASGRSEIIATIEHDGSLAAIIEGDEGTYIVASPTILYRWGGQDEAEVIADLSQERDGVALGWITDISLDKKGNFLVSGHTVDKDGQKGYPTIAWIDRQNGAREILLDELWHPDPLPEELPDIDPDALRDEYPGLLDFTTLTIQGIDVDGDGTIFFTTFWDNSALTDYGYQWPPSPLQLQRVGLDAEIALATEEAVMRFNPGSGDLQFILGGFHLRPARESPRLLDPRGLIVADEKIVVADHNTVKEIPAAGGSFTERYYESFGTGPLFGSPENIAIDPENGRLFVTDSHCNAVFRVHPRTGNRTLFSGSCGPDDEAGEGPELKLPWDIEMDRDGSLLVTGRGHSSPEWGCCFAGVLYRIDPSGDREILSPRPDGRPSGDPWVDPRWLSIHPCEDEDLIAVAEAQRRRGHFPEGHVPQLFYVTGANGQREAVVGPNLGLPVAIGDPIAYGPLGELYYATNNAVLKGPLEHRLVSGRFFGRTRGDGQDYTGGYSRDIDVDRDGTIFVLKENVLDVAGRYSPDRILTTVGRAPTLPDKPRRIFGIDPESGDREILFDCQTAEESDGHPPLPESIAMGGFGFPCPGEEEEEPENDDPKGGGLDVEISLDIKQLIPEKYEEAFHDIPMEWGREDDPGWCPSTGSPWPVPLPSPEPAPKPPFPMPPPY